MSPVHVWLGAISLQFVTRHFYCVASIGQVFFCMDVSSFFIMWTDSVDRILFSVAVKKSGIVWIECIRWTVCNGYEIDRNGKRWYRVRYLFVTFSFAFFSAFHSLYYHENSCFLRLLLFASFLLTLHECVCVCFGSYQWENKRPIAFIEMAREKNS